MKHPVKRMLADDFIRCAHLAPPDHDPPVEQFRYVAGLINQARRFEIETEARDACGGILCSKPSSIIQAMAFARPPFPITWFEWVPPYVETFKPGQYRAEKVGALVREVSPRSFRMFTCWKHASDRLIDELGINRLPASIRPFAELAGRLGISTLEAAWDFGVIDDRPTLDISNTEIHNWFRRPIASENPEYLRTQRNDRTNPIRHALADPDELKALAKIERCVAFRLHRETNVNDILQMAKRTGTSIETLIDDVKDDLAPMAALLIMMNAKNCVETAHVDPPEAFNRAQRKAGKPEIGEYTTVHLKLSRMQRAQAGSAGMTHDERRAHLVRGHFKVRKGGVFWWTGHARGHGAMAPQRYEVEA